MAMSPCYSDADRWRMTAVYKRAVQELKLQRASTAEHERLVICILSLGLTYDDPHRLPEKAVRNFLRGGRPVVPEMRKLTRASSRISA